MTVGAERAASTSTSTIACRGVVVDIEGTTSPTDAVHIGLYDYARPRIEPWLVAHATEPVTSAAIADTRAAAGLPADASSTDVAAALLSWMDGDVKATPLKTIQGQIWAQGFAGGELTGQFFDDVPLALHGWHDRGLGLAVFSSGSVASQRPWFRHGNLGDLSTLIDAYFDTITGGPKREVEAYQRIATDLTTRWDCTADQLVFLSDIPAELDAARSAGWIAIGVRRTGEPSEHADFGTHAVVASFADLHLERAA